MRGYHNGILELMNLVDNLVLPDDMKATIYECLENLIIGSTQAIKAIKAGQVIHNLPAYMSPADWTHLESNATMYDHICMSLPRGLPPWGWSA